MKHKLVEKKNPLAVHGIFSSKESAEAFLANDVPLYCKNGFYMDKSLTPDDFVVVEDKNKK